MVCKTCGTECGDESVCPMCGCNPNEEFGVDMGGESANNAPRQTTSDGPVGAIPQNNNQHDEPVDPIKEKKSLPGMGWFKFTIYFSLWANMALNILNAILMWTGASYGVDVERVYEVFPSLKGTDVFIGVLYLALAVYAIFVRIRLANFKKGSPMLLHILVAANLGITLLYAIIASGITGISFGELISGNIAQMIGVAVLLVVNIVYYNKHADLFDE